MHIPGIHHITAISGAPQANVDFYTGVLGLRMVKKTVNFDDPQTYHLYYGDETGRPGTLLTFFQFEDAVQGQCGAGMVHRIGFAVPPNSFSYWTERIAERTQRYHPPASRFGTPVLSFQDPDGLMLEIVPESGVEDLPGWSNEDIPSRHGIRCFSHATLLFDDASETGKLLEIMGYEPADRDGVFQRYVSAGEEESTSDDSDREHQPLVAACIDLETRSLSPGRSGRGTIHHIAFRLANEEQQLRWREIFIKAGLYPTEVKDRHYFKSIYFREPGGVLFELATDPPGMLIDESVEMLGTSLRLPPWYEDRRPEIVSRLPKLEI